MLMEYDWPGNVRELRFALIRALREANGSKIGQQSFAFLRSTPRPAKEAPNPALHATASMSEREWITDALARNGFRRQQTADELGMTTRTLYNKIKKYGLQG